MKFISIVGIGAVVTLALVISRTSETSILSLTGNNSTQFKGVDSRHLVIYPVPDGEVLSTDYSVEINGKEVGIQTARVNDVPYKMYDHGGTYSFINFDFRESVHIRIASKRSLEMLQIRPLSLNMQRRVIDEHTVELTLEKPCFISIEPEGKRHPLLIFANPLEIDVPDMNDPAVIYYGPGIHNPEGGLINLKSNQTLYLAGGAVVQAAINVQDAENVTIRGRGILDGNSWEHAKGPVHHFVNIVSSRNIKIEGIILRGSFLWTLIPQNCDYVTVENIKICGGRVLNDDGINPCNTRHMKTRHCFIRTDDDCIAVKGMKDEWGDVEDIVFEDMVLWNDRSMVARFGVESRTRSMKNMVFRNIDIIHYGRIAFSFEPYDETMIQDVLVEDMRIEGDGQSLLINVMPVIRPYYDNRIGGHVRNVHFKNVKLTGAWGDYGYASGPPYSIEVGAYDDKHYCKDIILEDIVILGEKLTQASPRFLTKADETDAWFRPKQWLLAKDDSAVIVK
jgi:hypothetical protein